MFWRDDARQTAVNVNATRHLVAAALKKRAGRFIFTSSQSVYAGDSGEYFEATESSPHEALQGRRNYGRSKAEAEQVVRAAGAQGLDYVILRPSNIMGRYDTGSWARLFQAVAKDALPVLADGGSATASVSEVTACPFASLFLHYLLWVERKAKKDVSILLCRWPRLT